MIGLAIKKGGAQLVSVTENIDETPSGRLLHGIMATIAEFYSRNLAAEALKGPPPSRPLASLKDDWRARKTG